MSSLADLMRSDLGLGDAEPGDVVGRAEAPAVVRQVPPPLGQSLHRETPEERSAAAARAYDIISREPPLTDPGDLAAQDRERNRAEKRVSLSDLMKQDLATPDIAPAQAPAPPAPSAIERAPEEEGDRTSLEPYEPQTGRSAIPTSALDRIAAKTQAPTAQDKIAARGAPVAPETAKRIQSQIDGAAPEERALLAGRKDWVGDVARAAVARLDKQQAQAVAMPSLQGAGTNVEARSQAIARQGAAPSVAANMADVENRFGLPPEPIQTASDMGVDEKGGEQYRQGLQTGRGSIGKVGVTQGLHQLTGAVNGALQLYADVTGDEKVGAEITKDAKLAKAAEDGIQAAMAKRPWAERIGAGAVASMTAQGPTIPFMYALPAVGIAGIGIQTFFNEYQETKLAGKSTNDALYRATLLGMSESLTELIGLPSFRTSAQKALQAFQGDIGPTEAKRMFQVWGRHVATEMTGEEVNTTVNFLVDKFAQFGIQPQATAADYFSQLIDTAATTLLQTGAMMAPGAARASRAVTLAGHDTQEQRTDERMKLEMMDWLVGPQKAPPAVSSSPASPAPPAAAPAFTPTHTLEDGRPVVPKMEDGKPSSGFWVGGDGEVIEAPRADPIDKGIEDNATWTVAGVPYDVAVVDKGRKDGTARLADGQEVPIDQLTLTDPAKDLLGLLPPTEKKPAAAPPSAKPAPVLTPAPPGVAPTPFDAEPPAAPAPPARVAPKPSEPPAAPAIPIVTPKLDGARNLQMQNRLRNNAVSIAQMQDIANNPDYDRLSASKAPESGAPMASIAGDQPVIPDGQLGRKSVVTIGGEKVPIQYAVVEANDLLASNSADGRERPEYFAEPKPGEIRALNNGRVAGIREAYVQDTAKDYRAALEADVDHGIELSFIAEMKRPVLVRVYPDSFNTSIENIGEKSQGETLDQSPVEVALQDAAKITDDDMRLFVPSENGDVSAASNDAFVKMFLNKVVTPRQRGRLVEQKTNKPNKALYDRIEAAIFQLAYQNQDLTGMFAEAKEPEIRNILNALSIAAPEMAKLKGAPEQLDIRPWVSAAALLSLNARRAGVSFEKCARQEEIGRDPTVAGYGRLMGDLVRSPRKLGDALKVGALWAQDAAAQAKNGDIFGDPPQYNASHALQSINKFVEENYGEGQRGADAEEAQAPKVAQEPPEYRAGREPADGADAQGGAERAAARAAPEHGKQAGAVRQGDVGAGEVIPAHVREIIRDAGGNPDTIQIIRNQGELAAARSKWGLPNSVALKAGGIPVGKSHSLFIDDDTGKPVAFAAANVTPLKAEQPSAEYTTAREAANRASQEFRRVTDAYRARKIGDAEFLKAKAEHDAAQREFDAAYAKEGARDEAGDEPLLTSPTPAALKAKADAIAKAEADKAKAQKEPPAKKVTVDQPDIFNTQGGLDLQQSALGKSLPDASVADTVKSGESGSGGATAKTGDGVVNRPNVGAPTKIGGGDSATRKGLQNRGWSDAKALADLRKGQTLLAELERLAQGPLARTSVDAPVFGLGRDQQIARLIVEAIPVDVMNNLSPEQRTPKNLLRNESVLKALGTHTANIDADQAVGGAVPREKSDVTASRRSTHNQTIPGNSSNSKQMLGIEDAEKVVDDDSGQIFVANEVNEKDGGVRHVALLGFDNLTDARNAYQAAHDEDWQRPSIVRISAPGFKLWAVDHTKEGPKGGKLTIQRAREFEARARGDVPAPEGTDPLPSGQASPQLDLFAQTPIPGTSAVVPEKVIVELQETRRFHLPAGKITNAAEAASAFSELVKSPRERFQIIALDKDQKPIAAYDLFAGTLMKTPVFAREIVTVVHMTPGVASIWIAHQHPSGEAEPSDADAEMTREIQQSGFTTKFGVEMAGHVVISGGNYASMNIMGEVVDQGSVPVTPMAQTSIPVLERVIRFENTGKRARLTDTVASRRYLQALNPKEAGLVVLDAKHSVIAWWPVPLDAAHIARGTLFGSQAADVFRAVGRNNPAAAILFAPEGTDERLVTMASRAIKDALGRADVELIDTFLQDATIDRSSPTAAFKLMSSAERGLMDSAGERTVNYSLAGRHTASTIESISKELASDPLYAALGGRVTVVQSAHELPPHIVRQAASVNALGSIEGVFDPLTGQMYLVAGKIPPGQASRVLLHESVGHFGMNQVLPAELGTDLKTAQLEIYAARTGQIMAEVNAGFLKGYRYNLKDEGDRAHAASEWLAKQAEQGKEQSLWQRFVAKVRAIFRSPKAPEWMRTKEWTDNDILRLIQKSRQAVLEGRGITAQEAGIPSFSYVGWYAAERMPRLKAQLNIAQSMLAKGDGADKVRIATGWFRNPHDGKWRREASDRGAALLKIMPVDRSKSASAEARALPQMENELDESQLFGKERVYKLSEVLRHPLLYRLYPAAKDIEFVVRKGFFDFGGLQGWFNGKNKIGVTPYSKEPLSTILHEVQHWIQTQEGFARGGNSNQVVDLLTDAQRARLAEHMIGKIDEKIAKDAQTLKDLDTVVANGTAAEMLGLKYEADRLWKQGAGNMPVGSSARDQWHAAYQAQGRANDRMRASMFKLEKQDWFKMSDEERSRFIEISIMLDRVGSSGWTSTEGRATIPSLRKELTDRIVTEQQKKSSLQSGDAKAIADLVKESGETFNLYQAIAGEIEARDVQARKDLTGKQRRETPPLSSSDIAAENVIVSFNDPGEAASMAWHGSPHEHNEFSTEYIGTGEGAQAYGWGLYFSGKRAVAEWYREKLTGGSRAELNAIEGTKDGLTVGGWNLLPEYFKPGRIVKSYAGWDEVIRFNGSPIGQWSVTVKSVKDQFGKPADVYDARPRTHATSPDAKEVIDVLSKDGWTFGKPGRLYQVELAPKEDEYLDWDKPLSEQSEKVRDALRNAAPPSGVSEKVANWVQRSMVGSTADGVQQRGASFYSHLAEQLGRDRMMGKPPMEWGPVTIGNEEAASRYLASIGIPGIRYLDGSSRAKGAGNSNYVIFDAAHVKIQAYFSLTPPSGAQGPTSAFGISRSDGRLRGMARRPSGAGAWTVLTTKGESTDMLRPGKYQQASAMTIAEVGQIFNAAGMDLRTARPPNMPPADAAVMEHSGRAFDLEDTDIKGITKAFVHPRTIASFDKDFAPVYAKIEQRAERRNQIVAELNNEWKRFLEGSTAEKRRVMAVLELGRLNKTTYGQGRLPIIVENTANTSAELSKVGDRFELTDKEKSMYWSMRRTMDQALVFIKNEMVRAAGLDPLTVTTPVQILNAIPVGAEPARARELKRLADNVKTVIEMRRTGYVPFSRFGELGIVVRDTSQNVIHFEKVEWDPKLAHPTELTTESMARRRADELRVKFPNGMVIGPFFMTEKESIGQIDLGELDQLARVAYLDKQEYADVRQALAEAQAKKGFAAHLSPAKDIPGYSPDLERSTADYILGVATHLANKQYGPEIEQAIGAIPGHKGDLREYARTTASYANSPQEELQRLRTANYLYYIAGNVATATFNLTQPALTTLPILSMFNPLSASWEISRAYGEASAMVGLFRSGNPIGLLKPNEFFDPQYAPADVRAALTSAWEKGFMAPLTTRDMMGLAQNRAENMRKLSNASQHTIEFIAHMFMTAERLNRITSYIAAYRVASKPGAKATIMRALKNNALATLNFTTTDNFPGAFAEWVVDEGQFRAGRDNRAQLQRGWGTAIFQFMDYAWQQMELYARTAKLAGPRGKLAFAAMMTILWLLAGTWGLPFAERFRALIEAMLGFMTKQDHDLKVALRAFVTDLTGNARVGELISYGVIRSVDDAPEAGMRIGLGNAGPNVNSPIGMLGVGADLLYTRPKNFAAWMSRDEPTMATAQVLPNFLKNMLEAKEWGRIGVKSAKTGNTVVKAEDLTSWDILLKGAGFRPRSVAEKTELEYAQDRRSHAVDEMRRAFYYRWGENLFLKQEAEKRGDADAAQAAQIKIDKVREQAAAYDASVPEYLKLNLQGRAVAERWAAEKIGPDIKDLKAPKATRGARRELRELYNQPF